MSCIDRFPLRLVVICWLAAGVILFSTAGHTADKASETYYQFKVHGNVPELNVFHPQGTVAVDLRWVKNFPSSVSGGIFRLCSGKEWIEDAHIKQAHGFKQKVLWRFFKPQPGHLDTYDIDDNYVRLKLLLNTPYIIRLPLRVPPETIQSSGYKEVSLAARTAYTFADNCQITAGVKQDPNDNPRHELIIKIPVPSLQDATPEIPDLDKTAAKVNNDQRNMTVTVPVFGASKDNTTVVWCDTEKPCDKARKGEQMNPGEEIMNEKNILIGARYSVTRPVPTRQDYIAYIEVTKQVAWPEAKTVTTQFPLVTSTLNAPQAKLLSCTDRQCTFQWRSVLPYRDQNGSLGLNFNGGLKPISGQLPAAIFTLQPDNWEESGLELFTEQPKTSLPVSNWQQYSEKNKEFLTEAPMPREGVIIVRFEPKQ